MAKTAQSSIDANIPKNATFRNVYPKDLAIIQEHFKKQKIGITDGSGFTLLLQQLQAAENSNGRNAEDIAKIEELEKKYEKFKELSNTMINSLETDVNRLKEDKTNLLKQIEILNHNEEGIKNECEKAISQYKELEKQVDELTNQEQNTGIQLEGLQFVCDLGEDIMTEARRARPFLQKGIYKKFTDFEPVDNEDPKQYLNRLVKFGTKRFLDFVRTEFL